MLKIEKSIKKFKQLPIEIQLIIDNEQIGNKIKEINTKYKVNFFPLLIYVVVGDLNEKQIQRYSKIEFGLSDIIANKASEEFLKNIIKPLIKKIEFFSSDFANRMDILEQKKILLNFFKENLIEEMNSNLIIIEIINSRIFNILSKDLKFQKELEKELYQNKEKLTTHKFILNKKPHSPTIENWIKDFISQNGSEIFNNLVLTKYITNSENTRNLDKTEKKMVQKLLQLYRNLKFFPESMSSDDPATWEIIPVSRDIEENITKKQIGIPQTQEEKNIQELKQEEEKYQSEGLEKLVLEEKIEIEKKIDDLKIEAKKYKDGSLEKMAIEEEINKMRD